LVIGSVSPEAVRAQLRKPPSSATQPAQKPVPTAPQDDLGRSTPRGAVVGFLTAGYEKNFDVAAQYLDTRLHDKDAALLAEKLFFVLDRRLPAKLNNVSDDPFGSLSDPLNSRRELVGTVASENGPVEIYVERIDRANGVSIWLFSRSTLAAIPDVYDEIEALAIENILPEYMLQRFYGATLFGWLFFLVGLPLAYFILSATNWILSKLFGYLRRRIKRQPDLPNPKILSHPVRLLIIAAAIEWMLSKVSLSLMARQLGSMTVAIVGIVALVWILILVNGKGEAYFRRRMESRGQIGAAAILPPARRVMDFIAVVIGFMFLLHSFGVNPSAALAGLGVGGIAVALAAQKTLENVIGGVSLILDEAVRVGDFFKVGEVTGTVEAIGLRSTRVRTVSRTVVNIPNGQMATMALENFSARDSFLMQQPIQILCDTAPSVLTSVLGDVHRLLDQDPRVLPRSMRVRFLRFGASSLELEVFAYVLAREWSHFLEIQEELLIQIRAFISSNGAEVAYPARTIYLKNEIDPEGNPDHPLHQVNSRNRQVHEPQIT